MNFTQALSAMPEWPKMVLFLPKGTSQTGVEFKWMHSLQEEFGSRLIMLSLVNDTEGESNIMNVFNVTEPDQLPCAKVIKPGSVDLKEGRVEVYEPRDAHGNRYVKWSMEMLKDLAEKTSLKIRQSFKKLKMASLQVTSPMDFQRLCINHKGRCVLLLVDVNKIKTQLAQFAKGFEKFESVFYDFHPMWADVSHAHGFLNFKQINPSVTPQVVMLDVKEKVFAPHPITTAAKFHTFLRSFDQPDAISRIRQAKQKGISPLMAEAALPTHTEL